jgi:hypothetical protein
VASKYFCKAEATILEPPHVPPLIPALIVAVVILLDKALTKPDVSQSIRESVPLITSFQSIP